MKFIFSSLIAACAFFISSLSFGQTLTVSAATSLTNAYKEIGQAFEAKYAGSKVEFNFGASGALLQQILQGAPVDVFACADQLTMDKAAAQGMIKEQTRAHFASNGLVLIVPINSTLEITSLSDLAMAHVKLVAIGNPATTPNASYAKAALEQAGVWSTLEPKLVLAANVRQSLHYVSKGEVDAGFVFSTDAWQDADKVRVALVIPTVKAGENLGEWQPSSIVYPIAQTQQSTQALAAKFIAFVLSDEGQAILAKYGFMPADNKHL